MTSTGNESQTYFYAAFLYFLASRHLSLLPHIWLFFKKRFPYCRHLLKPYFMLPNLATNSFEFPQFFSSCRHLLEPSDSYGATETAAERRRRQKTFNFAKSLGNVLFKHFISGAAVRGVSASTQRWWRGASPAAWPGQWARRIRRYTHKLDFKLKNVVFLE